MPFLFIYFVIVVEAVFWFFLNFIDLLQELASFLWAATLFLRWCLVHLCELILKALEVLVLF
jgi:hypothetical protein